MDILQHLFDTAVLNYKQQRSYLWEDWLKMKKPNQLSKSGELEIETHIKAFDEMIKADRYNDAAEVLSSLKIICYRERIKDW